ncbi:MAG: LCP family protein [Eubacterium sp.]
MNSQNNKNNDILTEEDIFGDDTNNPNINDDSVDVFERVHVYNKYTYDKNGNKYVNRRRRRHNKHNKRSRKWLKAILIIIIVLLTLAAGILAAYFFINNEGRHSLLDNNTGISSPDNLDVDTTDEGLTVTYKGKTYKYNENMTTILFACVDKFGLGTDVVGTAGQADSIALIAFDTKTGKCTLISVSRDSMTDVDIYNTNGEYVETVNEQLCLAFAYGDGNTSSCENLLTSVSRLFYGLPINSYYVMDFDAISAITAQVGGVTVTVNEDCFENYENGETVTLAGEDAVAYLRYRDTSTLDSNNARIIRQQQFLNAFMNKTINSLKSNLGNFFSLYNTVNEYSVTNLGISQVSYLASSYLGTSDTTLDIKTIQGEVIQGEEYAEFNVDKTALYELILEIYYNEID